jgi:hypothetical protein
VKSKGTLFNDFNTENTFQNNLFWGDAGTGREYKEKEMTKKNPLLQLNENKIYALTAQSPAINQADDKTSSMLDNEELKDDDFMILLDMEGQKREQKKDIGCDEFSKESKTNIPLTKKNTGPSYLNN